MTIIYGASPSSAASLEDPWNAPPENAYLWTVAPDKAPDKPAEVEVGFDEGRADVA